MSSHSDSFVDSGNSPTETDFIIQDEGSIFLLRPQNEQAIAWNETHIGHDNGFQPYYPTVVIEPRYVSDILEGISSDGFEVRR